MVALSKTMAQIPGGGTRRTYGTAYWDGSRWFAEIGGNLIDARWLDPIQPVQGGNIVVDITNDGMGQSTALVIGGYTDQPRPSTGTVTALVPAGPATLIKFTGQDGVSYTAERFVGSYNLGDVVLLDWAAAQPSVIGKVPALTVTPPSTQPIGGAAVMPGTTTLVATASDTFGVGGWGRWALSQRGGEKVYSGTQGGYTVTGAWFYGAPRPELAGKTITRVRFYLPARLPGTGASGSVTVHLYAHTSQARPGGDVARVAGPFDVTVPGGFGGVFVDLDPATFGPHLVAGGGISIAGNPYVGFVSRFDNPESGKLIIDWQA